MKKDAADQIEHLSRGLEVVWNEHGKLPEGLCVQSDNTYREGKNRFIIAWPITLFWFALGFSDGQCVPTYG